MKITNIYPKRYRLRTVLKTGVLIRKNIIIARLLAPPQTTSPLDNTLCPYDNKLNKSYLQQKLVEMRK